jgi:hypothetical protein
MENFDYSEIQELLILYERKYKGDLKEDQKDLLNELVIKLETLEDVSREIVLLVNELHSGKNFISFNDDELTFGNLKLKLKRADPKVPVILAGASTGYSKGFKGKKVDGETAELQRKLERRSYEFYQLAHRITHITEKLPSLKSFKCSQIRIIRNKLIEHPEGKDSGVTYDSFAYDMIEGPKIKGLRKDDQLRHMDPGFKKNSEEFISKLEKSLQSAI